MEDDYLALDWPDLERILRYFWVSPPELTIQTIEELVDSLYGLAQLEPNPVLSSLERVLDKTESSHLALDSIIELWNACGEICSAPPLERPFGRLKLSVITRSFSRKFGRIETSDVIELVELALRARESLDVLDALRLEDLIETLSDQSMRSLSLKDLRNTIERLVVLLKDGSLS